MTSDQSANGGPGGLIPRRTLGRTGEKLSVIGFGGIVVMGSDAESAASVVAEAVDRGVSYFDVAPSYGDAEDVLGPALAPHRDKVFLACKTERRDAAGARAHLEESLRKMRTDRFDLYQLHAITEVGKDVAAAMGPGGAMEALLEAREAGKVRYLGFSAHSREAALAAMEQFEFDTILYPVNAACHAVSEFDQGPLEAARARGMGILALKAMARQPWGSPGQAVEREAWAKCWYEPVTTRDEARDALAFTLGQEGVVAALPPGDERLLRLALDVAHEALASAGASALATTRAPGVPIFT